jgi:DNA-binding MarR family transcriptional regulator
MSCDTLLDIDKQICFSMYSASNAITRAYRPVLEELDLTYLQYMAMLVLWRDSPLNVKEIGEKLRLDSGTLTPLLKRMEQKGLVMRKRSVTDERARIISLTEQGIVLEDKALSVPEQMGCKVQITPEEAALLKKLADKVTDNLTK